jgi:hypothetical protein
MINESIINLADVDDDILDYEAADEAVEAAAGVLEGQTKSAPTFWPCVTISFCNDAPIGMGATPSSSAIRLQRRSR